MLLVAVATLVQLGGAAWGGEDEVDSFGEVDSPGEGAIDHTPYERALTVAIRLQPPVTGILAASRTGAAEGFEVAGASFGLRAFSWIEAEASVITTATICEGGSAYIWRAGLAPSVLRPSVQGTHWNLRIPLLASYVSYSGTSSCEDTYSSNPTKSLHAYLFSTGLEATRWNSGGRIGFDMRTLFGIGGGTEKDSVSSSQGWASAGQVTELSLSFGVLFQ